MTVRRGVCLLAIFASIALAVVHLRAEQTRCAASVLRLESDWVRLRSELWAVQARVARARAPDRIQDRATYLATGLIAPGTKNETENKQVERVAAQVPATKNPPARRQRGLPHKSSRSE